ncbi:MAG: hypothetical protein WDO73_31165 [Ignavibacteriota bacterium]
MTRRKRPPAASTRQIETTLKKFNFTQQSLIAVATMRDLAEAGHIAGEAAEESRDAPVRTSETQRQSTPPTPAARHSPSLAKQAEESLNAPVAAPEKSPNEPNATRQSTCSK